ncbi:MAG TPA: ATP-binding protein [Desulfuromonadales bacterium]|nr:ATP-binding protein [Desulfuromonadales bacterium]
MSRLCIRLPASLESLEPLRVFVEGHALRAGLDEAQARRLELALEEAVVNIIDHAYGGRGGELELCCNPMPRGLEIRLVDEGPPFNPLEAPPVAPLTDIASQRIGGMGIHLFRSLADGLRYRREGERNVLTLRFLRKNGDGP